MIRASALVAVASLAGSVHGQVINWNAGTGLWSAAANWDPMNVPDAAGESAVLDAGGIYTVTYDTLGSFDNIEVIDAGATLVINVGRIVALLAPAVVNHGLIRLPSSGSSSDVVLHFETTGTLDGTGEIRMEENADARLSGGAGAVITHGVSHLITGGGSIGLAMVNNGVIRANNGSQALDLSGPLTNNSLIEAAGGFLDVNGITITQGALGVIEAGTTSVRFFGANEIVGGTLRAPGAGIFDRTAGAGTTRLTDVAFESGEFHATAGGTIEVAGSGLTNDGTIRLLSSGSTSDTVLRFVESGELGGTGDLSMQEGVDAFLTAEPGATITHAASHLIHGAGNITAPVINDGVIRATLGSQALDLSGPLTNNSLIEAAGGFLDVNGITILQNAGGIIRAGATNVRFFGTNEIVGGTLSAPGAGIFDRTAGAGTTRLTDVVFESGEFHATAGGTIEVAGSGLTNDGTIRLLSSGSSTDTVLRFVDPGFLDGAGEVSLEEGIDTLLSAASGSIDHGNGHTISGIGTITAAISNHGRIAPGLSAGTLTATGEIFWESDGTFEVELGGTAIGTFDRIVGSGTHHLGGELEVSTLGVFTPAKNTSWTIMTGAAIDGEFAQVNAPAIPPGLRWVVVVQPTSAILWLVCEADCEVDGDLDVFDFLCFQSQYAAQAAYGDCEQDGDWDVFDFLCFQSKFATCP